MFLSFLIVSKYGSIRLGKDDDEPDYSYMTWFAMLFSAWYGYWLSFLGRCRTIKPFIRTSVWR
ncbi:BCCT family transporter [Bacillus cereus]